MKAFQIVRNNCKGNAIQGHQDREPYCLIAGSEKIEESECGCIYNAQDIPAKDDLGELRSRRGELVKEMMFSGFETITGLHLEPGQARWFVLREATPEEIKEAQEAALATA